MSIYKQQIEAGKIHALTPSFRRLLANTQAEMKAFCSEHSPAMIGLSWGKQSTVLAHMAFDLGLDPVNHFMAEPGHDIIANFSEVRDAFLSRWPIRYVEEMGDHHIKTRAREFRERNGIRGAIIGLCAEESKARKMSTAKGWIKYVADGCTRCTPLRFWRVPDVAAYHAIHDIPCLNTYRKFGFEARTSCGLGGHAEVGRKMLTSSQLRKYDEHIERTKSENNLPS